MRLYHKFYRHKNPKAALRGEKRAIYQSILGEPVSNPPGISDRINYWNFLGELNAAIDSGETGLIPLRDVVKAKTEGFLGAGQFKYSLHEAVRDLNSRQASIVRRMIDDVGGATPDERRVIEAEASQSLALRKGEARVRAKRDAESRLAAPLKSRISRPGEREVDYGRSADRRAAMEEQDRSARAAVGDERYVPADKALMKRVTDALTKKYPDGHIPPKLASVRRREAEYIAEIESEKDKSKKKALIKRYEEAVRSRWNTQRILEYEARGGKELSRSEIMHRKAQKMKDLGVRFPVASGYFGIIVKNEKKPGEFRWVLFDQDSYIYMSGSAASKIAASKSVDIAMRILAELTVLGDDSGWDNLPKKDRQWLNSKRPMLSRRIARMLRNYINERIRVTPSVARWIREYSHRSDISSAELPKSEVSVSESCKNMGLGEERVFAGHKGKYNIHVKRAAGGKFIYHVETSDGVKSQARRTSNCDDILPKANVIGGAMVGANEVSKAIQNPAKIKRLSSEANKHFRKANPKMPRQGADIGDIRDLTGMVGIPNDPNDAYKYGFYAGIIRGIDTCGVQHYLKRKKIRDEFQSKLMSAAMETTARVTGTRSGKMSPSRGRGRATQVIDDDDDDDLFYKG